jgi:hypothetical protein
MDIPRIPLPTDSKQPDYSIATPLLSSHLILEMNLKYYQKSLSTLRNVIGNMMCPDAESIRVLDDVISTFDVVYQQSARTLIRKLEWTEKTRARIRCVERKDGDGLCDICASKHNYYADIKCCNKRICSSCMAKHYWETTKSLTLGDSKCAYCRKEFHISSLLQVE